jgi:hypothetical protein
MPQERSYINVLGSSSGFRIDGNQLSVRGTQGTLVFRNARGPR